MKHRWFERGFICRIWSEKYIQMLNIRNTSLRATEELTLCKSTNMSIQTANDNNPYAMPVKQLHLHSSVLRVWLRPLLVLMSNNSHFSLIVTQTEKFSKDLWLFCDMQKKMLIKTR